MIVIFWKLQARVGDEERVLSALRKRAAAMLRDRAAGAVLVCQRIDLPQHLLWIQQPVRARIPADDREEFPPPTESGLVESEEALVRAAFVDGAYQFPLPPCLVWVAETSDERTARALLTSCQRASSDRHLFGVSLYRNMEDPSRMIAFFALARDLAPEDYFKSRREPQAPQLAFYPLRVSWTVGRLMPGAPSPASLVRYPRAAFWARSGVISPTGTLAVPAEQTRERSSTGGS
jgi:hypothetical protein